MSDPADLPPCCTPSENASLAERLFCIYNAGGPADRAGLAWDGRPVPPWSALPEDSPVRAKWEADAALVERLVLAAREEGFKEACELWAKAGEGDVLAAQELDRRLPGYGMAAGIDGNEGPLIGGKELCAILENDPDADYYTNVRILIVPEDAHAHLSDGDLDGATTFWLHTSGMTRHYGRPELELREVPAQFIDAAGKWLNGWARYSIEREIKAGESLSDKGATVPVKYVCEASPDPFWKEHGPCLWIYPERAAAVCAECAPAEDKDNTLKCPKCDARAHWGVSGEPGSKGHAYCSLSIHAARDSKSPQVSCDWIGTSIRQADGSVALHSVPQ